MNKTVVSDDTIREIRRQQLEGVKRSKVREQFPEISKDTFLGIWKGCPRRDVVPKLDKLR